MQRYYSEKRDVHGRVEPYATVSVFESGTDTLATIYDPSDTADTPSTAIVNPLQTDANGRYGFAATNGDYDIVCQGSGSQEYRVRVNLFDSTTSSSGGAGGNDTEVQYNSGGVLTGAPGLTTDGASLTARAIQWDTASPVTTLVQGNTYWDDTNETLSTVLDATNNVILQHGQEIHIACVNKTGSIIANGKAVYINDAQGNRPTCALARADALATCQVVGVTTQPIGINATGLVTVLGKVNDFNTFGFSADGVTLYLSAATAGELTETAPSSPNYVVRVGLALNTTPNGAIFVNPNRSLAADTTMVANTNTVPPTQKAVKAYADGVLTTAEAYTDTLRSDLASTSDVTKGDALLGVKSSLTGGVARTQHDKNSDFVDAKDFGAVVGSDIGAFVNLALASGAKKIRVNGSYTLSNQIVMNSLSEVTLDLSQSTITASSGLNASLIVLLSCQRCVVFPGVIDGNASGQSLSSFGIDLNGGSYNSVIGGRVTNCKTYGIYNIGCNHALVSNVETDNNQQAGVAGDTGSSDVVGFRIVNLVTHDNGLGGIGPMSGIHLEGNSGTGYYFKDVHISDITSYSNRGSGITFQTTRKFVMSNVTAFDNYMNGLTFAACMYGAGTGFVLDNNDVGGVAGYGNGIMVDDTSVTPPSQYIALSNITSLNHGGFTVLEKGTANNNLFTGVKSTDGGTFAFIGASTVGIAGGAITGTFTTSGSFTCNSVNGGFGYSTGAGGQVTQSTSKATGVTLNALSGRITTANDALGAGVVNSFTLTNSAISSTDCLVFNVVSGATPGAYHLNARPVNGAAEIEIRNITGGSLSEALVIVFNVIKGAVS